MDKYREVSELVEKKTKEFKEKVEKQNVEKKKLADDNKDLRSQLSASRSECSTLHS